MRPSRDLTLLKTAWVWADRGTCSRAHVGCVISKDGRILVQGYNGTPSGMGHCNHDCTCNFSNPVYQPPEAHSADCPFTAPCRLAVHAEANAIAYAAKVGVRLEGAELHTTRVPCTNCAMLLVNTGIVRVVWDERHRDMGGLKLLQRARVECIRHDMIAP